MTALMLASSNGDVGCAEALIGAGARVDMDLIDDYTLNVRTTDGAVKIWQRCRRLSS